MDKQVLKQLLLASVVDHQWTMFYSNSLPLFEAFIFFSPFLNSASIVRFHKQTSLPTLHRV